MGLSKTEATSPHWAGQCCHVDPYMGPHPWCPALSHPMGVLLSCFPYPCVFVLFSLPLLSKDYMFLWNHSYWIFSFSGHISWLVLPILVLAERIAQGSQHQPALSDPGSPLTHSTITSWKIILIPTIRCLKTCRVLITGPPGVLNGKETQKGGSICIYGLPWWLSGKESACQSRRHRFDPWVGKIPGGGNGNPLQYSCLENSMGRGPWCVCVCMYVYIYVYMCVCVYIYIYIWLIHFAAQ